MSVGRGTNSVFVDQLTMLLASGTAARLAMTCLPYQNSWVWGAA